MLHRPRITRERLDGTVVDIEFLLIAVVQGLALTTLAVESEQVIGDLQWVYWPYIIAGFILILNFWTLATVHSISFIGWPFDIVHTLLYMLVAFVEVAAFAQITHPEKWFLFMLAFFLVSALLYGWDMKMIRDRKADFDNSPARMALYRHIHDWQATEVKLILPAALVFQGVIVLLIWRAPDLLMAGERHLWLVAAQIIFGLAYLSYTLRTFAERRMLITAAIEEPHPVSSPSTG